MAVKAKAQITLYRVTGVEAVYRYYKLQSSTLAKPSKPTAVPPSGWDDVEPSYTAGSTNSLYTVDLTVFSDGTWKYSEVSLSSSYEAAKAAYNKAMAAGNAAQGAQDAVDNLKVGGRNMLVYKTMSFASGFGHEDLDANANTGIITGTGQYYLRFDVDFEPDTEYVIRAESVVLGDSEGKSCDLAIYDLEASKVAQSLGSLGSGQAVRFTTGANVSSSMPLFVYVSYGETTAYSIDRVKLEKGNRATDWTPAPEDVESQVQQLADKLSMLVVDAEGTTLLEQDSEGWTFNMADVASGLNAAAADAAAAAEELEKLAAYIRIKTENSAPLLELGDESAFKTQVTNEELRFMHGEEKVAYMNNEALHIERAVIEDKLNIGGFSWYESDDGGLAIVWEGSDE